MQAGRVLTADHQEFVLAEWDGVNRSGYEPLDDKVLVLIDEHADATSGGIALTAEFVERQTMASEHGVVVALGPAAFRWNDEGTRAWHGKRPEPGDRVYIERYSGQLLNGRDGRKYRLMSQKCVGAVALPEVGSGAPPNERPAVAQFAGAPIEFEPEVRVRPVDGALDQEPRES